MQLDDVLYEIDAKSENWMIAGRKRGYVSLSPKQGLFTLFITHKKLMVIGDLEPMRRKRSLGSNSAVILIMLFQ